MIYINGRFLTQRLTGVQRFALEITKQLIAIDTTIKIILPKSAEGTLSKDMMAILGKNLMFWGRGNSLYWEQVSLALLSKPDITLLNLCNSAPILWKNKITCIHDMSYRANPQWFSKAFRYYYSFLIPAIVSTSKQVITVSEFAKAEILKYISGIIPSKVTVINNACASVFKNDKLPAKAITGKDVFLFVGSVEPRKNLNNLLAAFSNITNKDAELVIVGAKNTKMFNAVEVNSSIDERIRWESSCSDERLKEIYLSAKALVNPSFYEGFGVPLIEAANNGCLLVLSDIPVFREIAAENAFYFNPGSVSDIEDSLLKIINLNADEASAIIKGAYENASENYDWKKSALKLYNLISANGII